MADANTRWGTKAATSMRAPDPVVSKRAWVRDLVAIAAGTVAIAGLGYALTQPGSGGDGVALTRDRNAVGGTDPTPIDGGWNTTAGAQNAPAAPVQAVADIPLVARTEAEHIDQTISYGSVMMPRLAAGVVNGFTIRAGAMPPVLARAGVRPGDVMVSVNGRALDSNAVVSGLSRDLAGAARADIVIERGGKRETLTTSLRD